MAKILITGVFGFLGSHLVSFLKDRGHYVRGVGKSLAKDRIPLTNKADQIICLSMEDLKSALLVTEGMEYVIHTAADMGGVGYFNAHDYYPFLKNMQMDINILKACEKNKVQRLFYTSSACIYPTYLQMTEGPAPKLREDQIFPAQADQMYGWEKLMTTMLCERAPFDARVGILNTVFGPYQETEGEKRKFPMAIAMKALHSKRTGEPIEIWGNGEQKRSFTYITDALEKIYHVLMADTYKGPVNIASDKAYTVTEYAQMCCDILGIPYNFVYKETAPSGVLSRNTDNRKFFTIYNYDNQVSAREGFRRLLEWLQGEGEKYEITALRSSGVV